MDKIMKSVLIVIISTVIGAFLAPMGDGNPLNGNFRRYRRDCQRHLSGLFLSPQEGNAI